MTRTVMDRIDAGVKRTVLVAGFLGLAAIAALPAAAADKADFSALKGTGLVPGEQTDINHAGSARDRDLLVYTATPQAGPRPLLTVTLGDGAGNKSLLRPDLVFGNSRLSEKGGIRRDADRALLGDFILSK